jgi:hypothetical protein
MQQNPLGMKRKEKKGKTVSSRQSITIFAEHNSCDIVKQYWCSRSICSIHCARWCTRTTCSIGGGSFKSTRNSPLRQQKTRQSAIAPLQSPMTCDGGCENFDTASRLCVYIVVFRVPCLWSVRFVLCRSTCCSPFSSLSAKSVVFIHYSEFSPWLSLSPMPRWQISWRAIRQILSLRVPRNYCRMYCRFGFAPGVTWLLFALSQSSVAIFG